MRLLELPAHRLLNHRTVGGTPFEDSGRATHRLSIAAESRMVI
jgi:hypothetical protein